MQQISLTNNTIHRRISNMSMDVNEQVLTEIKASPLFSLQLDESTDVSSCSQLLVFVRYIHSGDIKDEFLFCNSLETTTKADDVMEKISTFSKMEIFNGKTCVGLYRWGTSYAGIEIRIPVKSEEASTSSKGNLLHASPICSRQ